MPGHSSTSFAPEAANTLSSTRMVSTSAALDMGSTMPVVPITDRPPSMPMRGLKVLPASALPSGMLMTIDMPPSYPQRAQAERTCSAIICRGTELMAAAPTGWSSPGLVTRPTPSPPSIKMPSSIFRAVAQISMPLVMSGSSPLSFCTAQRAKSSPTSGSRMSRLRRMPLGVSISSRSTVRPVSSI